MRRVHMGKLLFLTTFLLADLAVAEEVTGSVKIVGSNVNAAVTLFETLDTPPTVLCGSDNTKKIDRHTSMKLKATGTWKNRPSGKDRCFDVFSFSIKDMSNGRTPLVGKIAE